nr:hypothetical protein [Chitinophagaceae bacterium]
MIKYNYIFLLVCIFTSCKAAKKTTSSSSSIERTYIESSKKNSTDIQVITCDGEEGLSWNEQINTPLLFPKGMQVPKNYRIFLVNEEALQAFCLKARVNVSRMIMAIPLFYNNTSNCVSLQIQDANTMSKELAYKYPELSTFSGFEISDKSKTARIIHSPEAGLNVEYNYENEKIFLIRVPGKDGNNYYISY